MSLLDAWVWFLVLGTAVLFFAGCWVVLRLARRHQEDDPRAMAKVGVAVVSSLLLGAGAFWLIHDFQERGVEGTHRTFVAALNKTIGEGDYLEAQGVIPKRTATLQTILLPRLAAINATLDAYVAANPEAGPAIANGTTAGLPPSVAENVTARRDTLRAIDGATKERSDAEVKVRKLTPNHALWLKVQPLLEAHRDHEAEALVMKAIDPATVTEVLPMNDATVANNEAPCERDVKGFCKSPLKAVAIEHDFYDAHLLANIPVSDGARQAFHHQEQYNHQMDAQLKVLFYSMITGIMVAPFVFAGGAILRRAFVPSDTVGFKPYPSKSAGFFLLLGAFGVLAIPFAAWTLRDLHKRSIEGQIAL